MLVPLDFMYTICKFKFKLHLPISLFAYLCELEANMSAATLPRSRHQSFYFVIIVIILCYPTAIGILRVTRSSQTTSQSSNLSRCQITYKNLTKGKLARCK